MDPILSSLEISDLKRIIDRHNKYYLKPNNKYPLLHPDTKYRTTQRIIGNIYPYHLIQYLPYMEIPCGMNIPSPRIREEYLWNLKRIRSLSDEIQKIKVEDEKWKELQGRLVLSVEETLNLWTRYDLENCGSPVDYMRSIGMK